MRQSNSGMGRASGRARDSTPRGACACWSAAPVGATPPKATLLRLAFRWDRRNWEDGYDYCLCIPAVDEVSPSWGSGNGHEWHLYAATVSGRNGSRGYNKASRASRFMHRRLTCAENLLRTGAVILGQFPMATWLQLRLRIVGRTVSMRRKWESFAVQTAPCTCYDVGAQPS